jgi:Holliday junction DNA helicase RuvA
MISLIEGKIISITNGEVIIMTRGGVGYKLSVSPKTLERCQIENEILVDTHLVVREDAHELYGFVDSSEKELFKHFLSVSGVGPKTALHLLALGSVKEISSAIGRGDTDYLTKVSGIGKKTAERIVLELRSKIEVSSIEYQVLNETNGGVLNDVIDGLIALGYASAEARAVVKKLNADGKTNEQLLKEALQNIK